MRRAVILDRTQNDETLMAFRVIFWLPVPVGLRAPLPAFVSALTGSLAPTAAELTALRNGSVREVEHTGIVSKHASDGAERTTQQLVIALRDDLTLSYQIRLAKANAAGNRAILFGTTYSDENGWVIVQSAG